MDHPTEWGKEPYPQKTFKYLISSNKLLLWKLFWLWKKNSKNEFCEIHLFQKNQRSIASQSPQMVALVAFHWFLTLENKCPQIIYIKTLFYFQEMKLQILLGKIQLETKNERTDNSQKASSRVWLALRLTLTMTGLSSVGFGGAEEHSPSLAIKQCRFRVLS